MPLFIVVLVVCGCEKLVKMDVNCWTGRWPPVWEVAVHLAVAGDVFDGVFLCCPVSRGMSWMRSGT